jgi:Thrombospondin type 1 domain/EGF-like domain
MQVCSGHGICTERGTCRCFEGYSGIDCELCDTELGYQSGANGTCVAAGKCPPPPEPPLAPPTPRVAGAPPVAYVKVFSEWSRCSRECGGGVQTRTFQCVDPEGQAVDKSAHRSSLIQI